MDSTVSTEETLTIVYSWDEPFGETNEEGKIFETNPDRDDQKIISEIAWDQSWKDARQIWDQAKKENLRGFM